MASNLERVVINGTLLLNLMWPVGSIYSSTKSTDPGTIFGGTWTRIKGKTIVGVDENDATFKSVKSSGGEKTHTLTITEMPSHNHTTQYSYCCSAVATNGGGSGWTHFTANNTSSGINYTGGGGAHNNMPPYYTVYMWERTA